MSCQCTTTTPTWYPRRLIDLRELKNQCGLDTRNLTSTGKHDRVTLNNTEVYVFERDRARDWENGSPIHSNKRYITLSHCWGDGVSITLTPENFEAQTERGITLSSLLSTFKDAVEFAARLNDVGCLWVDSMHPPGFKSSFREDWLVESAVMGDVYCESYLPLSATAAQKATRDYFIPERRNFYYKTRSH
ncbi:hypothetical protein K491DRAFT_722574 [Lophiostoma macrostomum CBS 122681]|uniref:Heterokaryon incompatibility domain-containing protein n=1 Tax=Lophiostoma macrostomum CBS 122681 TaxID=1314788 RepID=A0A6A6SNA1_9PLEO|nr:hypothetical protein K491DRAFT_722574 [Lophiostoma macrostomum CBS 122681]